MPAPFSWLTRLANPLFQSFLFCSAEASSLFLANQTRKSALSELSLLLRRRQLPFLGQPDSQIRSFRAFSSAPQKTAPFSWPTRLANPLFQSFLFCSAEDSSLFLVNQTRKSALSELSLLLRRRICSLKHARKGNACFAVAPFSWHVSHYTISTGEMLCYEER